MQTSTMENNVVEQTTKNIELVGRLIDEILDGSTELDSNARSIPLVLIPVDDPELARKNFELSLRMADDGITTRLQLIGKRPVDSSAWRETDMHSIEVKNITPHWPKVQPTSDDLRIIYDRSRDALLVTFKARRTHITSVPLSPYVAVQINPKTQEISGYLIVSFLQVVAQNSPTLISAFRKARFRKITERELGGILVTGKEEKLSDIETVNVINEFNRLIA